MHRAYLPKALALTLFTAGLFAAGAQQPQPAPDATVPQAQTATPPFHHRTADPQHEAQLLTRKLNLSADQTAKIEPILADRNQQIQTLLANQQMSPEERHQQMRSINQHTKQQMASVLSPEQMAQLKELRHHHGHHEQNGQSADSGPAAS